MLGLVAVASRLIMQVIVAGVTCTVLAACSGGTVLASDAEADDASEPDDDGMPADADEVEEDAADAAEAVDRECVTGEPGPVDTWLTHLGSTSGTLAVASVCVAVNGDIGLAGTWRPTAAVAADLWVARLDPTGSLLWQVRIPGSFTLPLEIVPRPGGGFVIGAPVSGSSVAEPWLLGLDDTGAVEWHRWFRSGNFFGVGATLDGGFVSFLNAPTGALISRFDDAGSVVWQRRSADRRFHTDAVVLGDGGIAALLSEYAYMDPDMWLHYEMSLVRLTAGGESGWRIRWTGAWTWGERDYDSPWGSLLPLPEGGLVMSESRGSGLGFSMHAFDAGGEPLWEGVMGGAGSPSSGVLFDDRGALLTGWAGVGTVWLALLDLRGAVRWQRSVEDVREVGSRWNAAARANDGGALFLGGGPDGPQWLAKLGPDGEFGGTCPELACPHAVFESTGIMLAAEPTDLFEVTRDEPHYGSAASIPDAVAWAERACPE